MAITMKSGLAGLIGTALALLVVLVARAGEAGANRGLPEGAEQVILNPAEFTTKIDNRFFPLRVGSRWVYRETDKEGARQKVVVTVTDETKLIANGVTARVVRDVVSEDGEFVEVTDDWYAQDSKGNVWYLGEATTEYQNGKPVSTAGSFEAGVDGAQAGVIMPADPKPGTRYRQEYYAGQAEDRAKVLSLKQEVEVSFGSFDRVLKTKEVAPLAPRSFEIKFYARGIGVVEAFTVKGGSDHEVLLKFRRG
jgi:hypothetical protein